MGARFYLVSIVLLSAVICSRGIADGPEPRRGIANDLEVTAIEGEAIRCRTAQAAMEKYKQFIQSHDLTDKQLELLERRMKRWQERIDAGLVKLGGEWVTEAQAQAVGKRADLLVFEAYEKLQAGDYKATRTLLERASKTDPAGIRADYILGMLNSPNLWNYAVAAERYFEIASRRDPENVEILNNLALSRVKLGRCSDAIDLWSTALLSDREVQPVVQNLGRFVKEVSAKRLVAPKLVADRALKLHDKAVADRKSVASDPRVGWLYSRVALPADEARRADLKQAAVKSGLPPEEIQLHSVYIGNGTGFFVHPHYILTNRHVVDGSDFVRILDPADRTVEYDAEVTARAKGLDLAIIHCDRLDGDPVSIREGMPRRGSDVLVLGFPLAYKLGDSLKSTRGQIAGLPDDTFKYLWIDATVNPGNSGGPIIDRSANVVAICTIKTAFEDRSQDNYGGALPIDWAMPLLKDEIPDFAPRQSDVQFDWPEIDERLSRSTVMIRRYGRAVPVVARSPGPQDTKVVDIFEDRTCTACKGRIRIACPAVGCTRGSVADFEESWQIQGVGAGQQVFKSRTPRSAKCPDCRGVGVVDCPHCRDGSDPGLR